MNAEQIGAIVADQGNIEWLLRRREITTFEVEGSCLRHESGRDVNRTRRTQGNFSQSTLLLLHHHGDYTGETTIEIHPGTIADDILSAVRATASVDSARYSLASASAFSLPRTQGAITAQRASDTFTQIYELVTQDDQVRVARARNRVQGIDNTVVSSVGHDVSFQTTSAYVELMLIHDMDGDSSFLMLEREASDVEGLRLESSLQTALEDLRHQKEGRVFPSYSGPIVLVGDAARDFFVGGALTLSPFLYHSSAEHRFSLGSPMGIGTSFASGDIRGDRLDISSDPTLGLGLGSYGLSKYGAVPQRVSLVEASTLVGTHANQQYGTYAGVPVTGALGNVVVGCGTTPLTDMIEDGLTVVSAFAAFKARPKEGIIATKAQTGYTVESGESRAATAGIVHIDYGDALRDITLSSQSQTNGNYIGPMAIRIERARIDGD